MFFSNLRRNKENILYFILTILCLEYVRTHYNKLEDRARENGWGKKVLERRRAFLLMSATLVYGVFVALPLLNFLISLTHKITSTYHDTAFLKTNIALIANLILSYAVSIIIVRILLPRYIKAMNGFSNFWKKIGRSAWDGTKVVVKAPSRMAEATKNTIYKGVKKTHGAILRMFEKDRE